MKVELGGGTGVLAKAHVLSIVFFFKNSPVHLSYKSEKLFQLFPISEIYILTGQGEEKFCY
jgi:hypothetical protein